MVDELRPACNSETDPAQALRDVAVVGVDLQEVWVLPPCSESLRS